MNEIASTVAPAPDRLPVSWLSRINVKPAFLIVPAVILLLVTYIVPLLQLLRLSFSDGGPGDITGSGFTLDNYGAFFADPTSLRVMWRSLWIAVVTTAIAVLIAFPYAVSMSRSSTLMRRALVIIALLPMTTSGVVRAYGIIMVLGQNGAINSLLQWLGVIDQPLSLLYGPIALIVGNVYFCLPFVILPLAAGVSRLDRRVLEASQTLGARGWQTFFTVTLPLLVPALAAGSLIAFTLTMTSYVTPGLLGGQGYLVVTTLLGQKMFDLANWVSGAVVSVVLLAIVLLVTTTYQSWMDRRSRFYATR